MICHGGLFVSAAQESIRQPYTAADDIVAQESLKRETAAIY